MKVKDIIGGKRLADYNPAICQTAAAGQPAPNSGGKRGKPYETIMNQSRKIVDGLSLHTDIPTQLTFEQLYAWVIWQFPRPRQDGMCGAVRPPCQHEGWLPAIIRRQEEVAAVYGHVPQIFSTPEAAADWLATLET